MPEHESAPTAPVGGVAGGYPPMTPLRGAVPGWPEDEPLTSAVTPRAARAVLQADAETSVVDPAGQRRLWVKDIAAVVTIGFAVVAVVSLVKVATGPGTRVLTWPVFLTWTLLLWLPMILRLLTRAWPARGVVPSSPGARVRWHLRVWREPAIASAPAAWLPGSEAYAVLVAACRAESITPSWLCERVGLPPDVGAQWIATLRREGWLTGGGRALGWSRLPELHLEITDVGREHLEAERTRRRALASV